MKIFGFEQYGGPEVLHFVDVAEPEAREGVLLGRLVCASLNPADVKVRDGQRIGKVPVEFPMAVGREATVEVLADAEGFRAGEVVFGSCAAGTGALAEVVALEASQSVRVPRGVTPEQAACLPVAAGTAWDALNELGTQEGDTVLVLGAGGGVGAHACQLGRHLGATPIGVASAPKAEVLGRVGGVHVVSGPGWVERVRELAPDGVDAIIDAVGGDVLREAATLVGDASKIRSSASPAVAKELGGSGVTRRRSATVYAELAELVALGRLEPIIGASFDFDQAAEAVAEVETGHTTGKVVVRL